ncbi:ABC transporter substrate-binding protein [Oculatella sp. LEGE 06141]|nr:ABC transporter substrate-binding protein [Oculatella sp. LEGE 06141]
MPQMITRRRTLWIMGGLAGGLALHACTQQPQTSSDATSASADAPAESIAATTASTLWIGYTPFYIALEKGFFQESGLNLDYKVMSTTGEIDAAFASGRLDGQNNVTSEAVALAAKGQDFRVVMVADTSNGGDGILARNSVADIADFRGKSVAVEVGGVSHFFLLQVLEEAGLTADDVEITNLSPDAAAAAYQAGRADIAVTYSPFLKQANDAQPDGRIIYDTTQMPTAIVDLYIFNPEFVQANPAGMQAFVDGVLKGIEFIETNPDEAYEIAGRRLELSPEDVATELQGVKLTTLEDNIQMLSNPESEVYLLGHMDALGQFLKDQNQIPQPPSEATISQLLEPTFVKAAQEKA